jgi:uncharacterized protein (TIGR04551 family)
MTRHARGLILVWTLVPLVHSHLALAQTPRTTGPAPGPGGTLGEEEKKEQGNAEKAPKEQTQLPTLPPLPPYPNQDHKKFELIELDGYLRLRTTWFDGFNLGYHDTGQGIPFRQALTCREDTPDSLVTPVKSKGCSAAIGSANMRLRLEPTIHVSETLDVHIQADLLDNLVLGSTTNGIFFDGTTLDPSVPGGAFSNGQAPPQAGKNSPWDSVRVKQAYGVAKTSLGELRFGRMPDHWGLGILHNSGGYDWVHGTVCLDCDFGTNVDRVIFGTTIPGTSLRGAIGLTWASTGPSAGQLDVWKNRYDGQPYDLDDSDDTTEYDFMLTRIDDPATWKQTVDAGGVALNYGVYVAYRTQDFEAPLVTLGSPAPELNYIGRHLSEYIPDVWARFTYKKLTVETELVAVLGSIDNLLQSQTPTTTQPAQDIRMFGGVLRASYLMLNDDFNLSLEVGFASGDQWESPTQGLINIHEVNYFPQDINATRISAFHFNPDYHVDLILWRELYGAVINALYAKPSFSYNFSERIRFMGAVIASFPHLPVSTPGNGSIYGVELDGDLGYYSPGDGFFAGIAYGAFFPMSAMDHPPDLFPTEVKNTGDTAQTFQVRMAIKF